LKSMLSPLERRAVAATRPPFPPLDGGRDPPKLTKGIAPLFR
jgi:hypothetical protein